MPRPTPIFYPAPVTPLTIEEIKHTFSQFHAGDPIMVALRQILAERLAGATADNIEPRLNERQAGMVAGRMQEISSLQDELNTFTAASALRAAVAANKPRKT